MGEHLLKNWIVYVMLGGFIWLVVAMVTSARRQEKKDESEARQKNDSNP